MSEATGSAAWFRHDETICSVTCLWIYGQCEIAAHEKPVVDERGPE